MTSSKDFDKYTNIRELIKDQIEENQTEGKPPKINDDLIHNIFTKFVPIKEAWCWTFLKNLEMKRSYFETVRFIIFSKNMCDNFFFCYRIVLIHHRSLK